MPAPVYVGWGHEHVAHLHAAGMGLVNHNCVFLKGVDVPSMSSTPTKNQLVNWSAAGRGSEAAA